MEINHEWNDKEGGIKMNESETYTALQEAKYRLEGALEEIKTLDGKLGADRKSVV